MGQIKHAIGQRYKINEIFFGSAQDPDVDDGRNFLLQNLWYSQSLKGSFSLWATTAIIRQIAAWRSPVAGSVSLNANTLLVVPTA